MKHALLVVPRFAIVFLIILVFLCMIQIVFQWGISYAPEAERPDGWFLEALPATLDSSIVPGTILAIFLSFSHARRERGERIAAFLTTIVVSSALLVFGGIFAGNLTEHSGMSSKTVSMPFAEKRIHVAGDTIVFPFEVFPATGRMENTVTLVREERTIGTTDWNMEYQRGVTYRDSESVIETEEKRFVISPSNPVYGKMFSPPDFARAIINEVQEFTRYLYQARNGSVEQYALAAVAMCTFAAGCYWCVRLTRWPLFNFVAAVFLLRVILLVFEVFTGSFVREMLEVIENKQLVDNLPILVFFLLGIVFVSLDILFSNPKKNT